MCTGAFLAAAWGQQPTGKGVISGSVVEGENNDPIRKAVVTLTLQGAPRRWATERTDSSGRFQFEGLPAGKYDLRAAKTNEGAAIYGADSVRELSDLITLDDGQIRNGIVLRFVRRGSISGHVYDSGGDPVGNVNVSLLRPGRDLGAPVLFNFRGAQTDDRGEYRVGNLDPGKYYLRASPSPQLGGPAPGRHTMLVEQYYGGARDSHDAFPIYLRGAENLSGLDLHLASEAAVEIRGRILGVPSVTEPAQAQPPGAGFRAVIGGAGVQVSMRPVNDLGRWAYGDFVAQAPEYGFQMTGFTTGRYRIEAVFTSGTKTYGATQILDLRPDSPEILLTLAPAMDIQGTLRLEGQTSPADGRSAPPNDTGTSNRGTRIQGTRVQLVRPGAQQQQDSISAQVRPDGRFTLEQVLPGDWQLGVNPVLPGFLKSARLGDKDVLLTTFEINGSNDAALNIVVSMRTATLEGEVDSVPPASKRAGILIAPVGRFHNLLRFYYDTAADDEGKFKLSGIAPGKYKIFAFEKLTPANFFALEAVDQLDDLGETIEFAEGATLEAHPKLVPADRAMKALQ